MSANEEPKSGLGECSLELEQEERQVLSNGVFEWCGAAHPTEELALAFGFANVGQMITGCKQLSEQISSGGPLHPREWRRAIALAEVCLGSGIFGGADDAEYTHGLAPGPASSVLATIRLKWRRKEVELPRDGGSLSLGTDPLTDRLGVFQPDPNPGPLADLQRRRDLARVLTELVAAPSAGRSTWLGDAAEALQKLGFLDDLAAWIGTSLYAEESGAAARLATSVRDPRGVDPFERLEASFRGYAAAAELHARLASRNSDSGSERGVRT